MVYRGRPSRACKICRKRRIRCDLKPEGCGNCARAGHVCPGYRDRIDMMFCDETAIVVEKHHPTSSTSSVTSRRSSPEKTTCISLPMTSDIMLQQTADEVALAYCHNYHLIRGGTQSRLIQDEGVLACLKAMGMGSLSVDSSSSHLADHARRYYVMALKHTNAALLSPEDVEKDNTLFSVICLSYYELIMGRDQASWDSWHTHIRGTSTLIQMRGIAQLETPDGRALFLMACIWLISVCQHKTQRLPGYITDLLAHATSTASAVLRPMWQVALSNAHLANLRADLANGTLTDPDEIVCRACALETELIDGGPRSTAQWQFDVLSDESGDGVPGIPYRHTYQHTMAAHIWNAVRYVRLYLHLIMVAAALQPACTLDPEERFLLIAKSQAVVLRMQTDILASVPHFLGIIPANNHDSPVGTRQRTGKMPPASMDIFEAGGIGPMNVPILHTSRGYMLLWSLRMIGEMHAPGTAMRKAASSMLHLAGKNLAISQAYLHEKMLEESIEPFLFHGVDTWDWPTE